MITCTLWSRYDDYGHEQPPEAYFLEINLNNNGINLIEYLPDSTADRQWKKLKSALPEYFIHSSNEMTLTPEQAIRLVEEFRENQADVDKWTNVFNEYKQELAA